MADGRRVSMVGFFGPEQKELVQMMYGSASEDYLLLLESLGDFFEKEIEPTARQTDLKAEIHQYGLSQRLWWIGASLAYLRRSYGDVREGLRQHRSFARHSRDML